MLSPKIHTALQHQLNQTLNHLSPTSPVYDLSQPQLQLIDSQIDLRFELQPTNTTQPDTLLFETKTAISLTSDNQIHWVNPRGTVNGRPISSRFLVSIGATVTRQLKLNWLNQKGILAKIIKLYIDNHKLEIVVFMQIQPQT